MDDLQQQLQLQLRASAEAEALTKRQAEAERQREAARERAAESETTSAPAYTASAGSWQSSKIATNGSSSSRAETLKRSADAGAALFARMLAGSRSADKALEAQVRDLVLLM